jgi:hypothetical protein
MENVYLIDIGRFDFKVKEENKWINKDLLLS